MSQPNLAELPRKLDFEGANNFRDLGGYPVAGGMRVKYGMVFRSDQLGNLTDADQDLLSAIGLRTVVDFRRRVEREEILDRIDDPGVRQISLPVEAEAADVKNLRRLMEEGRVSAQGAKQYLIDANEHFIRSFGQVFRDYLELLLDESSYPLVFHCSAGKDRAGFAAALTLWVAGASIETVMHDYLATNHCTANYVNGILEGLSDVEGLNVSPEAVQTLMQVQPAFLQRALDTIAEDFGSVEAYLEKGLNFGPENQGRVRSFICEQLG
jgi:protein-tyrosine phosphatase